LSGDTSAVHGVANGAILPFQTAVCVGAAIATGVSPITTVMPIQAIVRRIFVLHVIWYSSMQKRGRVHLPGSDLMQGGRCAVEGL
jgi:hypothetical protein